MRKGSNVMIYDKAKGLFIGSIVGDVYGAPYEFKSPEHLELEHPEYKSGEYSSGGPFNLPKGYYTDDTSMMLCLSKSLIKCDGTLIQTNNMDYYYNWYKDGVLSSTGECFDIGIATKRALDQYELTGQLSQMNEENCGNGALMRLTPIPIIYDDLTTALMACQYQTVTTHFSTKCIFVNHIITELLHNLIKTVSHSQCIELIKIAKRKVDDLVTGEVIGSGYVIDTAYIALESVLETSDFTSAIIKACSHGFDTDTNACVTGMIAGALYGYKAIPKHLSEEILHINDMKEIFYKLVDLRWDNAQ